MRLLTTCKAFLWLYYPLECRDKCNIKNRFNNSSSKQFSARLPSLFHRVNPAAISQRSIETGGMPAEKVALGSRGGRRCATSLLSTTLSPCLGILNGVHIAHRWLHPYLKSEGHVFFSFIYFWGTLGFFANSHLNQCTVFWSFWLMRGFAITMHAMWTLQFIMTSCSPMQSYDSSKSYSQKSVWMWFNQNLAQPIKAPLIWHAFTLHHYQSVAFEEKRSNMTVTSIQIPQWSNEWILWSLQRAHPFDRGSNWTLERLKGLRHSPSHPRALLVWAPV